MLYFSGSLPHPVGSLSRITVPLAAFCFATLIVLFGALVAVLPGEDPDFGFFGHCQRQVAPNLSAGRTLAANCVTAFFFDGSVNYVTKRSNSVFSRNLIVVNVDLNDREIAKRTRNPFSLRNRDFRYAVMDYSNFEGADFTGSNFTGASFKNANLTKAQFECANTGSFSTGCANLKDANLEGSNLAQANFVEAVLVNANLNRARGREAQFTRAILTSAEFNWADLAGASFEGAQLSRASLPYARAQAASFDEIRGVNTDFWGSHLQGASFRKARLLFADFSSASLEGVDFTLGSLQGASLRSARLVGVGLEHAILKGADLFQAQVWHTELPSPAAVELTRISGIRHMAPDEKHVEWLKEVRSKLQELRFHAASERLDKALTPTQWIDIDQYKSWMANETSVRSKGLLTDYLANILCLQEDETYMVASAEALLARTSEGDLGYFDLGGFDAIPLPRIPESDATLFPEDNAVWVDAPETTLAAPLWQPFFTRPNEFWIDESVLSRAVERDQCFGGKTLPEWLLKRYQNLKRTLGAKRD